MRSAALILGLIGGIIGLFAAGFAIVVGGIGTAVQANRAGTVVVLGFIALGLAVIGIVGGALAQTKPRAAALLMVVAGIAGFVAVSLFWIVAGVLLLIGALLAFLGRAKTLESRPVQVAPDPLTVAKAESPSS
jgi:hypothetical protein